MAALYFVLFLWMMGNKFNFCGTQTLRPGGVQLTLCAPLCYFGLRAAQVPLPRVADAEACKSGVVWYEACGCIKPFFSGLDTLPQGGVPA